MGRWLGKASDPADDRAGLVVWGLGVGGVLLLVSQLAYIGAKGATIDIPYCDCGLQQQETISQFWALMLVQGAVGWLVNGVGVLWTIGVAAAAVVLGRDRMSSTWRMYSWVVVAVGVVSVLVSVLRIGDQAGQLATALLSGVLLPIWLVWSAERLARSPVAVPVDGGEELSG